MNISITGRQYKPNKKTKEYIENEINKLKKYFDRIVDCKVILEKSREGDKAEISLSVTGNVLYSEETTTEMIKSFDSALNKVERQLRKYKEKITR